jgi:tRNA dimethylallyltransferase
LKRTAKSKIPVIVIFAPTASGKTALTSELFSPGGSHFILNAEIISADSQSVYKYMDIGTAKAEKSLQEVLPHHLIDLVSPDQQFTVADFVSRADAACKEIWQKNKIPVVCGGTGFYIRNFLDGLPSTPESSLQVRSQLQQRLANEGKEVLYNELKLIDPESASKIHINDEYRICRALEVFYTTGKTRSSFLLQNKLREEYDFLFIILEPERELLFERIRKRVDLMFEAGLEEEVKNLIKMGYTKESPGMKAIGYAEFFKCNDIEEIKKMIKHNSCKYAKKQFTYVRDIGIGNKIQYNNPSQDLEKVINLIKDFSS